jgi:hypothetical protein
MSIFENALLYKMLVIMVNAASLSAEVSLKLKIFPKKIISCGLKQCGLK